MNYIEFQQELNSYCESHDEYRAILAFTDEFTQITDFREIFLRIKQGEPIQYIASKAYFHRYHFKVSPATLIPRPETEELCEWVLKEHPETTQFILDIGTGSGCIPITLLLERPRWKGIAIDISSDALKMAQENSQFHQVSSRLELLELDVLNTHRLPTANIWISNPPYISSEEKASMRNNVLHYEPHIALFAGENPLIFYQKMSQLFLKDDSANEFWLELNQYYADEILELFLHQKLKAKKIEDLSGNPRFLRVVKI